MTYRKTLSLSLRVVETIEVEGDEQPPSLPPFPIDVDGECVEETTRPLAKCPSVSSNRHLKLVGSR